MGRYINADGVDLTSGSWTTIFDADAGDGPAARAVNYWVPSDESNGAELYIVPVHGPDPSGDPTDGEYVAAGGSVTRAAILPNNAGGITKVYARGDGGDSALFGGVEQS